MHSSKLLHLIRGLRQEELHWFQKFLASPFYNINEEYIALFKYIKKYYPDLKAPKLSKAETFKKLYPKEKFNLQKMRKAMHGLAVLAEEFFVAMRIRKQNYQREKLIMEELGERNLYPQFEKRAKTLIRDLEALPYRDAHFYKEIHELNLMHYGHVETSKEKRNMPIIISSIEHLDYYYLLQRQRLEFTIKSHEKLIGNKHSIKPLTETKVYLKQEPIFKIYELIIKALSISENESIYSEIEELFKNEAKRLGRKDQLEIIRILLNHLSSQINKGKEGYAVKMLALYKFGLEQNLVTEKGQIGETTFTNITTVGILANDFDWVEDFIKAYKKYLPYAEREDAACLSTALLYFHKKEYSRTIELMLYYSFSTPLLALKAKAILLRTYFEQFSIDNSYYELFISQTQSFEKFIRRNESISSGKKEIYLKFIFLVRKVANAILQNAVNKQLYNSVKNADGLVLKSWLLEKIEAKL